MTLDILWPSAQLAYTAAAAGTAGVAWSVLTHQPPKREKWLLSAALLALGLEYLAMMIDAGLHANEVALAPFTIWSGVGHSFLVTFWALLILFLLAVLNRVPRRDRSTRDVSMLILATTTIGIAVTGGLLGRVLYGVFTDADPDWIQRALGLLIADVTPFPVFAVGFSLAWGTVLRRLPAGERTGWIRWVLRAAGHPVVPPVDQRHEPPSTRDDITVFLIVIGALTMVTANVIVLRTTLEWTPGRLLFAVACQVCLLPTLVGVVYYHERYLFFDVVIKRGILFIGLAAVVGGSVFAALARAASIRPWQSAALSTALALMAYVAVRSGGHIDRWLDRLVFGRPVYAAELQSLSAAMAQCADEESLAATATSGLARSLRADFVRYECEGPTDSRLTIRVPNADGRDWYLSCGPRRRGQRYGSQDVVFVEAIAGQFAALSAGFHVRRAHAAAMAAEIRALRAQINPHFLFNALNTLADMARDQPATERTILNLSHVFRYVLECTKHEVVTLGEELGAARAYLEIERARFDDRLAFDIDAPEALLETPIPPMVLQPLLENAVKHGLSATGRAGHIRVAAHADNGYVCLSVRDDGVGFETRRTAPNVGLSNVRTRVELGGGSMHVESTPGAGTIIWVRIAIGAYRNSLPERSRRETLFG